MKKFSIVDFGNISGPAADVINNFMDKISSALEWIVTPKGIKPTIIEANKSIIKEISNRQDINPIERAAIINNFNRIIKEFTNQIDIVKDLEPDSKPKDVSDDWITFFFDKVKNVNEDYMKEIWAKF